MLIINSSHCIPAMVSAGVCHTVLLRSDGGAIAKGNIEDGQCDIHPLDDGLAYTKVAAGRGHTVLLCSDGSAVAIGENDFGQCNIPALDQGMAYTKVSAGDRNTVLLRSDGCVVAIGDNEEGQCNIPALNEGLAYTQICAGLRHTALLCSDGCAVVAGDSTMRYCQIPALDEGMAYTQIWLGWYSEVCGFWAGGACFGDRGFFFSCVAQCPKSWCCWHLYLAWLSWRWQFWPYCLVLSLSSMQHGYPAQAGWVSCGSVWVGHFSCGCWHGSCSCLACFCAANHLGTSAWLLKCYADPCMIYCWCRLRWPGFPPFCFGVDYWRVFWYLFRAFLLCGLGGGAVHSVPVHVRYSFGGSSLVKFHTYTQISGGYEHTVLLRSDGCAVAVGENCDGQCNIPPLDEGMAYAQVSAGGLHTVLLRSDGSAVAIGDNFLGQCDIPPLNEGMVYTQISAGLYHTVLLRSDGCAVAIGDNEDGQCDIPTPEPGISYIRDMTCGGALALQLEFVRKDDAVTLICSTLSGEERRRLTAQAVDSAWETHKRIARELKMHLPNLQLVLPDGQLLAQICHANPGASVAEVAQRTHHP